MYLNNTPSIEGAFQKLLKTPEERRVSLDVTATCQLDNKNNLQPTFFEDSKHALAFKRHEDSTFVLTTEVLVLILMAVCVSINTFYVPFRMKPYDIPLIFRDSETSEWYDRMRISNGIFLVTFALAGILPMIGLVNYGDPCLTTYDPQAITLRQLDQYQYQLCIILWIITVPAVIMLISSVTQDMSRVICFPFLIANMVFSFMLLVLSIIVLIEKINGSGIDDIRYLHIANFATFVGTFMICKLWLWCCDRRDIIKDPRSAK